MGVLTIPAAGSASAASQAKYEAVGGWYGQLRLRTDTIRTIGNYTSDKIATMSKNSMDLKVYVQDGTYTVILFCSVQGAANLATGLLSALPADGSDVVIYFHCDGTGKVAATGVPGGTVIHSASDAFGSTATGAGTGAVSLLSETGDTTKVIDSYALFNAARTGDARFAEPLPADADVIGLYGMPESSGTTTADAETGDPLTLAGGAALSGGGAWNSGVVPVYTSLSISNPNTEYILGELLLPITVTKLDQFGSPFTGTPPATVTVDSLSLPVNVAGTLTESFVGAVATFDDLTPFSLITLTGTLAIAAVGGRATFATLRVNF